MGESALPNDHAESPHVDPTISFGPPVWSLVGATSEATVDCSNRFQVEHGDFWLSNETGPMAPDLPGFGAFAHQEIEFLVTDTSLAHGVK